MATQLASGAAVPSRRVRAVNGRQVNVPAKRGRAHLQFRRFAGCPICHVLLCSFADRYVEVVGTGITVVVLFDSPDAELRGYWSVLPFPVVADPDWVLYRDFGVDTGLRAIADPREWWTGIRGGTAALLHRHDPDYVAVGSADGTTHWGLPADFLVDPDGTVVAAHYGHNADDQWSVDRLLEVHRLHRGAAPPP
ncbi:redoxin domain-containing protein [Mycolicibacter sp. MYC340]|uniref:Redoxin domain-containing protein n=1 Tax=[Mycobacterium] nativiensis TaxID=2855503 RepID=A0ABU5XZF5_9MYCO|nr:redoxin domain-containing protein [Mycolicibacter sp. MYC340]MEB3033379.1 redoxin domain-containing protein [Mycolicibacter sp. MYC340]